MDTQKNRNDSRMAEIKVTRWRGSQHPTHQTITQQMAREGLRPYTWTQGPNFRDGVRSHGYSKVLYCVEGVLEIVLPDINQRITLRPGDRVELPRGVRHAAIIGPRGARCVLNCRVVYVMPPLLARVEHAASKAC
jgi:hypothetical protein